MKIVNVHEAKTHFSQLLERAHNGEEIIVAKAGKPWARLLPLERPGPRVAGQRAIKSGEAALEPLDEEQLAAWGEQ
ncbi:MAG: type II toxin-antitoxin system Phd/YefM family antitoxin [Polyangiales bacterium]